MGFLDTLGQTNKPTGGFLENLGSSPAPAQPQGNAEPLGSSLIAKPFNALSNIGIGVGSVIGKTGFGLGELAFRTAGAGAGALGFNKVAEEQKRLADQTAQTSQDIYQKPFESQLATKSGQLGTAIGGIAPYFSGAGLVKAPTLGSGILPTLKYAVKSALVDTGINLAQTGGKDLTSAGITGGVSALGNAIVPGGGITRRIASNVLPGYVSDVASGLAGYRGEDRKGVNSAIPGLGTLTGGVLGGINAYGYVKSGGYAQAKAQKTVDKRMGTLEGLQSNNKPLNRVIVSADKSGIDVKKYLAESDLLSGAIDKQGTIRTKNALESLDESIAPWENKVGEVIQAEGKTVSLKNVQSKVDDVINSSGLVGSAKQSAKNSLLKEIEALSQEADVNGNVPLKLVHDLKVQTNRLNTKSFLDPEKNAIGKTIGRGLKEFVEENTGAIDAKTYNAELRKLYGVRDVLKSLDGKKVLGGRAGKYFSQTIGAIVGSSVGGIPGGIAGAEAGNLIRERQLQSQFGGTGGKAVQATGEMKNALLPQSNLGNRQINQPTANSTSKNPISPTIPQPKKVSRNQAYEEYAKMTSDTERKAFVEKQKNLLEEKLTQAKKAVQEGK